MNTILIAMQGIPVSGTKHFSWRCLRMKFSREGGLKQKNKSFIFYGIGLWFTWNLHNFVVLNIMSKILLINRYCQ